MAETSNNVISIQNKNDDNMEDGSLKDIFERQLKEYYASQSNSEHNVKKPWTSERILEVVNHIKKIKLSSQRDSSDYYWSSKYDIIEESGRDVLVFKRKSESDHIVRIIALEDYFDTLLEVHQSVSYGGRDKISQAIKNKLHIPKKAIELYLKICSYCDMKRLTPRKCNNIPIIKPDYNSKGQLEFINFESRQDGDYSWLMCYQDNATKFLHLRPLRSRNIDEVSFELLKIFLEFGPPCNFYTDNGKEFTTSIIDKLVQLWPECEFIRACPRRAQCRGNVERSKHDIESNLYSWMDENKSTKWSTGCYFVQYCVNVTFHSAIGKSPYRSLFGFDPNGKTKSSECVEVVSSSGGDINVARDEPARCEEVATPDVDFNFVTVQQADDRQLDLKEIFPYYICNDCMAKIDSFVQSSLSCKLSDVKFEGLCRVCVCSLDVEDVACKIEQFISESKCRTEIEVKIESNASVDEEQVNSDTFIKNDDESSEDDLNLNFLRIDQKPRKKKFKKVKAIAKGKVWNKGGRTFRGVPMFEGGLPEITEEILKLKETNFEQYKKEMEKRHCPECKRIFASRISCNYHYQRMHMKLKPFICHVCGNTYHSRCSLTSHISRMHASTNKHKCKLCEFAGARYQDLQQHMPIHAKAERPLKCPHCDVTFRHRASRSRHIKRHSVPYPYWCGECDKKYVEKRSYDRHMARNHKGFLKYQCRYCPKKYGYDISIRHHYKTVHNLDGNMCDFDISDSKIESE